MKKIKKTDGMHTFLLLLKVSFLLARARAYSMHITVVQYIHDMYHVQYAYNILFNNMSRGQ